MYSVDANIVIDIVTVLGVNGQHKLHSCSTCRCLCVCVCVCVQVCGGVGGAVGQSNAGASECMALGSEHAAGGAAAVGSSGEPLALGPLDV